MTISRYLIAVALAALLLTACAGPGEVTPRTTTVSRGALVLDGPVTRVRDGDTVLVNDPAVSPEPVPVRFRGVAAPELSEPGGKEAKAWLERAVLGKRVTCTLTGKPNHDRQVGYCVTYADVGDALIAAGQARRCPAFDPERRYPDGNATLPLPPYCKAPMPEPKP
jgi:endonuclease YncB( thermonuclease family)